MSESVYVALIGAVATIVGIIVPVLSTQKSERRKQNGKLDSIEKKLDMQEKDLCRTQILLLMSDYPDDKAEIMKIAQHYFSDLKGDWYLTGMFNAWLEQNCIGKPEWFTGE